MSPTEPSNILKGLVKVGRIRGIYLEQKQTGTDTADTLCTITGSGGTLQGRWDAYSQYLDIRPFFDGIAQIKKPYLEQYTEWREFEVENANELAEYRRLKKKFEGG